jgi:hypothetical protein
MNALQIFGSAFEMILKYIIVTLLFITENY